MTTNQPSEPTRYRITCDGDELCVLYCDEPYEDRRRAKRCAQHIVNAQRHVGRYMLEWEGGRLAVWQGTWAGFYTHRESDDLRNLEAWYRQTAASRGWSDYARCADVVQAEIDRRENKTPTFSGDEIEARRIHFARYLERLDREERLGYRGGERDFGYELLEASCSTA